MESVGTKYSGRASDKVGRFDWGKYFGIVWSISLWEKLKFLYYGRGSLFETKYWINRAIARSLLKKSEGESYSNALNLIAKQLNNFANSLKRQKTESKKQNSMIREASIEYFVDVEKRPLFNEVELNWILNDVQSQYEISNLQSLISNLSKNL
jgi:hypothetical protein